MSRISALTTYLQSLGIPLEGVSGGADGVRIDFTVSATKEQREQAQAIADRWDWRPRESKERAEIASDLLSRTDVRNRILDEVVLDWAAANPDRAKKAIAAAGVEYDVDKPVETEAR